MLLRASKKTLLAASASASSAAAAHLWFHHQRCFGSERRRPLRHSGGGGRRGGAFEDGFDDGFSDDVGGQRKNVSRGGDRWRDDDFDDADIRSRNPRRAARTGRRDWDDDGSFGAFGSRKHGGASQRGRRYEPSDGDANSDDQEFGSPDVRGSRTGTRQGQLDRADYDHRSGFRGSKRGERSRQDDDHSFVDRNGNSRGFGSQMRESRSSRSSSSSGILHAQRDWNGNGTSSAIGKHSSRSDDFNFDSDDDVEDSDGDYSSLKKDVPRNISSSNSSGTLLGKSLLEGFSDGSKDAVDNGGKDKEKTNKAGIGESLLQKLRIGAKKEASGNEEDKEKVERHEISAVDKSESLAADTDARPPEVDEIFRKMKESGLIPNAVAMLDGLCKDGLIQEAMKLFGLMRETRTMPEVVIYTAAVDGFIRAAKLDDAVRIFRKMQNNGIVPNAFSYGVLVQGLCRGGRLDDAVALSIEMFEAGHSPNAATFVGLVDGFCKTKGTEEAVRLVKSFQDRNFAIDGKSIREHIDKNGPFSEDVWEAIFGKKISLSASF